MRNFENFTGIIYLNNSGTRWIAWDKGRHTTGEWLTKSGKTVHRRVIYFYSFGNFGGACIHYKGKRIKVLNDQILED